MTYIIYVEVFEVQIHILFAKDIYYFSKENLETWN